MKPRTIVHYSDATTYGGVERVVCMLLSRIDRARWRPLLYVHDTPGAEMLVKEAVRLDVECRHLPPPDSAGDIRSLARFCRQLRVDRPDVFHAHLNWPLGARLGVLSAWLARVPYVVATAHLYHPIDGARWARMKQWLQSASIDRYVAVSEEVAHRLEKNLGVDARKVRVVRNGIEVPSGPSPEQEDLRRNLQGGQRRPVVLTVARLHAQKGLRYLLEAAVRLPDVSFAIAGDGPDRDQLTRVAADLGVAERVHWLGHRTDVRALLNASDLFVLPSLYEGLPLSILEAMSEYRPVVATSIPGTKELVSDGATGWLAPPGNGPALADTIAAALSDPKKAAAMAAAAYDLVRTRFSVDAMVKSLEAIYQEDLGALPR